MLGIQYPSYLLAEDKIKLDRMVAGINAIVAPDRPARIQAAINWLAEKKEAISVAAEFPELSTGFSKSLCDAFSGLQKAIASPAKSNTEKFTAFVQFHEKLDQELKTLRPEYGADDLIPFGVAFFLSLRLNSHQETALIRLLLNRPEELEGRLEALAVQYVGMLLYISDLKLACCVDLAQAGASNSQLIDRVDLAFLGRGELEEIYLSKVDFVLSMPARTPQFREAQAVKISQLVDKYLARVRQEVAKALEALPAPEKAEKATALYLRMFNFYRQFWSRELPVESIRSSMAHIDKICLSAECFEACAKAVFSISPEELRGERLALLERLTNSIWQAFDELEPKPGLDYRLLWLRILAANSNDRALRSFFRDKLASLPPLEMQSIRGTGGGQVAAGVLNAYQPVGLDDSLNTSGGSAMEP